MLLYQYPPKMSTHEKRISELNRKTEEKKIKKRGIINFLLAIFMLVLAIYSGKALVMILVFLVALYTAFLGFALFKLSGGYNNKLTTYIYDDRIIHVQQAFFSKKLISFDLAYSDVSRSFQDRLGNLILEYSDNEGNEKKAVLKFVIPDPKYYLIKNLAEEIKYSNTDRR